MANKYTNFSKASTSTVLARVCGSARMCLSKRTYNDEEEAEAAVVAVAQDKGWPMRMYKCPHCMKWHLSRIKSPL
jgi:hypothetical protein